MADLPLGHSREQSSSSNAVVGGGDPQSLITDHLDIWTSAIKSKSSAGRGSSNKLELVGIKKLRELILELAVRGKLVPQDPNDEPASELLKKIEAEKARLVKEGKIKKQKPLLPITDVEKPFELPIGWTFTRLGELFLTINSGGTPSKRNSDYWGGDVPWASVKDLGTQRYIDETQDHITEEGLNNGSRLANIDDILICTRMGLGKISIVKSPMAYNQDLKAVSLTSNVSVEYFINTYATLKIKGTGTTVEGIKQEQLLEYIIGFPPLREQHRIVAKVDELMALCDQLETQTESSIQAHQVLVETLLATLSNAKDAIELNDNWQTISQHFDVLFTTQDSIDQLKQTILQLAVMGKLVKQNPNDEPASKLLERIAAEKQQLIKAKIYQKTSTLKKNYTLIVPKHWELVQVGELCPSIVPNRDRPKSFTGNIPWVTLPGFPQTQLYLEPQNVDLALTPNEVEEYSARLIPSNSVLMSCVGRFGLTAINKIPVTCNQQVHAFICIDGLLPEYLSYVLRSAGKRLENAATSTTIAYLNKTNCESIEIGLPPSNEQKRIVEKVEELITLCDSLTAKLNQAQTTQLHLTDAIVEQAL